MKGILKGIADFFSAALLVAFLAAASHAQSNSGLDSDIGNPGLGGKNTIQGRIYYPSGHPLDRRVRIKVRSVRDRKSVV